jgi:hypothetical protein
MTSIELAAFLATSVLTGAAWVAVGACVFLVSAKGGPGIAKAIIEPPDVITDRQPPREGLRESVVLYGRVVRSVLVFVGLFMIVCGLIVIAGIALAG